MSSLLNEIERRKKLEKIRGKAATTKPKAKLGTDPEGPTLNEILRSKGLTTRPASQGRKDILRGGKVVLGDAHAGMVWEWLAAGGDRKPAKKPATKKPAKKKPAKKKAAKKKPAKKKPAKKKAAKKKAAKKKKAKKEFLTVEQLRAELARVKKVVKKKNAAKAKAAKKGKK